MRPPLSASGRGSDRRGAALKETTMKTNRFLSLPLLLSAALVLTSRVSFPEAQENYSETGTLTEMQAVPCGSQARGFTGIGGLLATAGVERVNSKDKLCQEYVLRTSYLEYRIRPMDDKDAALLPVGEKSRFRIKKDRVLLSVPEGDGKVREYKVVGVKPLTADEDSRPAAYAKNEAPVLEHRPAADSARPASGGTTNSAPPAATDPANPAKASPTVAASPPPGGPNGATLAVLPADSRQTGLPSLAPQTVSLAPQDDPTGSVNTPLTRVQVMGLVSGGVSSQRVAALVSERGISFQPSPEFVTDLKSVGATDELLNALAAAKSQAAPASKPAVRSITVQQPSAPGAPVTEVRYLQNTEQQDRAAEMARPDDPQVHLALAAALGQEGKWSEAAAQYAAVVSSQPNDAAAHSDLALALKRSGDVDGAIREYRRALEISPTLAATHDNLGVALSQKGDVKGAIAEFQAAIRLDPANSQAHNNLGSILEQQKDADGAIREYRQALSLGGDCCDAHYNLATALELKGDLDGAVAEFRQAVKTKPNDAATRVGLAGALERKGDVAGALEQYAIAVKLAPQDSAIRAHYDRLAGVSSAQNGGGSGN
jgi:Flp pilus assembly protein TadD